jgi:hypothetical protein
MAGGRRCVPTHARYASGPTHWLSVVTESLSTAHKHHKKGSGDCAVDGWEEGQLPAESQGSTPPQPVEADAAAGTDAAVDAEQHGEGGDQAAAVGAPDGWSPDEDGWPVW